jgi:hypothetical protein
VIFHERASVEITGLFLFCAFFTSTIMKHVVKNGGKKNERRITICNVRTFGRRINDNVVRKEETNDI